MAFQRLHASAADGTFSSRGAQEWNAAHVVSGATVGGIPYCPTATTETTSSGLTFNATGAAGDGLAIAAGTATTDVNALNVTQTWNAAGVTFTAIKHVITDTASANGSLAFQILGGASGTTNIFSIDRAGSVAVGNVTNSLVAGQLCTANSVRVAAGASFFWNTRSILQSPSDGIIQMYNNAGSAGCALDFLESTAPSGTANTARLFAQDNGAGKTQLMVIFGSGAAIQLAIEV